MGNEHTVAISVAYGLFIGIADQAAKLSQGSAAHRGPHLPIVGNNHHKDDRRFGM